MESRFPLPKLINHIPSHARGANHRGLPGVPIPGERGEDVRGMVVGRGKGRGKGSDGEGDGGEKNRREGEKDRKESRIEERG